MCENIAYFIFIPIEEKPIVYIPLKANPSMTLLCLTIVDLIVVYKCTRVYNTA